MTKIKIKKFITFEKSTCIDLLIILVLVKFIKNL
jgi:hypothetical protein